MSHSCASQIQHADTGRGLTHYQSTQRHQGGMALPHCHTHLFEQGLKLTIRQNDNIYELHILDVIYLKSFGPTVYTQLQHQKCPIDHHILPSKNCYSKSLLCLFQEWMCDHCHS